MRITRPRPLATRPSVTVVVPCYNYGHHLAEMAAWVLDQPGVDIRISIVDDASSDGSGELAAALARSDERISVLQHEQNRGHIQTYNDGLSRVRTDYVVLLSADDLLPPGAISRAVALMEHHPRVGLVYGHARSFSGEPPLPRKRLRNWTIWSGTRWIGASARQGRCFVVSPEVVMRTKALQSCGLYDLRLPHSGDFDMWLRTGLEWQIGRVNGPDQALYRVHESNMHLTTFQGWVTDLRERRATFDILFDEHATDRADIQRLRPRVRRALAIEAVRRATVGHRDGLHRRETDALVEFALQTDSTVMSSVIGLKWRLVPGRDRKLPAAGLRRWGSRVRDHLRWRCERRYGI